MGGWDCYCALCGGPLGPIYWDTEDEANTRDYEADVLSGPEDAELAWLEDCRIIGKDTESDLLCKVWVSGPATYEMYGSMNFEAGDDPDPALIDADSIVVYSNWSDDPWSVPFHVRCREILCRYIGIPVSEMDKEALFEAFVAIDTEMDNSSCLSIDYGDIAEQMGQYWSTSSDTEHFVFNPVEVKGLNEYLTNLPRRALEPSTTRTLHNTNGDPFASLPSDILMIIMEHLDKVATVYKLRRVSPAFANTELDNSFWKNRLYNMPWVWELPAIISAHERDGIDWERTYRKLYWGSKRYSRKQNKMYGLCNRRRIWEQMCPDFAEAYLENKARLGQWGTTTPIVLKGAFEALLKNLTCDGPMSEDAKLYTLLDSFVDLPAAKPSIEVSWTDDGKLVDVRVLNGGWSTKNASIELTSLADTVNNIPIPEDDWLAGFIVTTTRRPKTRRRQVIGIEILFAKQLPVQLGCAEGDKHLIHVKADNFIVALKSNRTPDGLINRIRLVEQALVHANGCLRVVDTLKDNYSIDSTRCLWQKELPPANSTIISVPPSRFSAFPMFDESPKEFLMFGTTDEELADVTGLSVDIRHGGLEVTFGNRPSRSIGPRRQAMKTLRIDGQGGERIVRIYVAWNNNTVESMRFVTNRGRYLIAGESAHHGIAMDSSHNRDTYMMPCGLYAFWPSDDSSHLDWFIGAFGSTAVGHADKRKMPNLAKDAQGFLWEPSRLPMEFKETGTIWGSCGAYDSSRPGAAYLPFTACTVSWLDCRRPLSEVRVTMTHSVPEIVHVKQGTMFQAPISAIRFKYADGEEAAVGPSEFPADPTCECHKTESATEEMEAVPHYRHQTWKVGGKRLKKLRIWHPQSGTLPAIQFVAEGQVESPVWGRWGHDAADKDVTELCFDGEGDGEAIGLKLFFQSIEREKARPDSIMGGIQALKYKGQLETVTAGPAPVMKALDGI